MKGSYLGDWTCREDVETSYQVILEPGINILLACYTYEDYSGYAWVLFEKGDKLYITSGSHCSCYGLEDQWEPVSETNIAVLKQTDIAGHDVGVWREAQKRLQDIIRQLEGPVFEYWVEKVYTYTLKCGLVGDPEMWIGYQLNSRLAQRLAHSPHELEYLIYRLTDNLKQIIEKEQAE